MNVFPTPPPSPEPRRRFLEIIRYRRAKASTGGTLPPPSNRSRYAGIILGALALGAVVFGVDKCQKSEYSDGPKDGHYINIAGDPGIKEPAKAQYGGEAKCDLNEGSCSAVDARTNQEYPGGYVVRYVCEGVVVNCDRTYAPTKVVSGPEYGKHLTLGRVEKNRTVQIDAFDGKHELKGFIAWSNGL